MKCTCVASSALAVLVSSLIGCTSADSVVAANVQSSNDTQYSSITGSGKKGGLVEPGIPESILNPGSTSNDLKKAKTVRFTVRQDGQDDIVHEVEPKATTSWKIDVLDAEGKPVKGDDDKPKQEEHKAIGAFFERMTLTSGWKGQAEAMAEAVDDSDNVLLTAKTSFEVEENGAVYVSLDLKLPEPPPVPTTGAGGTSGTGASSASASTGGSAVTSSSSATGGSSSSSSSASSATGGTSTSGSSALVGGSSAGGSSAK